MDTEESDHHGILRELVDHFERLAELLARSIESLGETGADFGQIERLQRAQAAAVRGAELARSKLTNPSPMD